MGSRPLLELFPPDASGNRIPSAKTSVKTDAPIARPAWTAPKSPAPRRPPTPASRPFRNDSHERTTTALVVAINRHDRLIVLTGEPGVGKTTACRSVIEQLDRRTLVSFLENHPVSVAGLLRRILLDFGVMSETMDRQPRAEDEHDLALILREFLASLAPLRAHAVVFVDDAHQVPVDVLRAIPAMGDGESARLLQFVLVGDPRLTELVQRSELSELDELVALRRRLEPLAERELQPYLLHRLASRGHASVVFRAAALARTFELSEGNPRRVNLLCDATLAASPQALTLDRHDVDAAAVELGLIPQPPQRSWPRRLTIAATLLLLALAGGSIALWAYGSSLARAVNRWQDIPAPPPAPSLRTKQPAAALPAPPDPDGDRRIDENQSN
jgi:general secretion pathway protein A